MTRNEWAIGMNQTFVVYVSDDTGSELDPVQFYGFIANDAQQYAQRGMKVTSMSSVPLRHSAAFLAREGSGYQTKVAVAVVYTGP